MTMRISVWHSSDRRALRAGNPEKNICVFLGGTARGRCRTVLLLGANGFIGMHLLRDLLDDDRIERVYALVRGQSTTSGPERVAQQLHKFGMSLPREVRDCDLRRVKIADPWLVDVNQGHGKIAVCNNS